MTQPTLSLHPIRAAIIDGSATELDVMIKLAAPLAPEKDTPRPKMNVAIVLDRSGSMEGRPMDEAKRCASFMIDRLTKSDFVSVVSFDTEVDVLAPAKPAGKGHKGRANTALARLFSRGGTDLHSGWLTGAEQAAVNTAPDVISRVLVLTDGETNAGVTDHHAIARHCAELARAGVSTSTYGLGSSFNENLLSAMAAKGEGQAYYGETAEDLMDPFCEEFDLMSALCARKIRLKLKFGKGVTGRVVNDFQMADGGRVKLPDLAYEGAVWALVRLTVSKNAPHAKDGRVSLLTAEVDCVDITGEPLTQLASDLELPRVDRKVFDAMPVDVDVRARGQELRAKELLELANAAALDYNWDKVDEIIKIALTEAGDNGWVEASILAIKAHADAREFYEMRKKASYAGGKLNSYMFSIVAEEDLALYSKQAESQKPSFLRRKADQGRAMDRQDDSGNS
jgi:Ca-activated chloride channel homolog